MNGKLNKAVLRDVSRKTTVTTAFVFGIFLGATAFAVVLRSLGGDAFIADILTGLPFSPGGIVLFILFVAFIAGFFLDWLEISLILLPLVGPVVASLGFDLTWFVVLFALTLQTSFLTPPVGFFAVLSQRSGAAGSQNHRHLQGRDSLYSVAGAGGDAGVFLAGSGALVARGPLRLMRVEGPLRPLLF